MKKTKDEEGYDILKEHLVLSDSGGLQERTLGADNGSDPEYIKKTFLWQQENSHIGFSFDVIPFDFKKGVFLKNKFIDYAKQSKNNIDHALKFRDKTKFPNFKYYGIIQGREYEEYKQWYDILKHPELEGYCVKSHSTSPISGAITSCFVMKELDKPVHFLGQGNLSRSIIPIYLSNYFPHQISFDSSSFDTGSQFRTLMVPYFGMKLIQINESSIIKDWSNWFISNKTFANIDGKLINTMVKENSVQLGILISLSNLETTANLVDFFKTIKHDKNLILQYISYMFGEDTYNKIKTALDMIDECAEKGWDYVFEKYIKNQNSITKEERTTINLLQL